MPNNPKSCLASKDNLVQAIEHSSSVKECLEFLGLRAAGGNYNQFYKWCLHYGLTPPKGDRSIGLRRAAQRKKISLEEILTTDSTYHRGSLKSRLLDARLLVNQCYECNQPPTWNGKSLTLQLDHINGISDDNRLSNLRLLCPNCHSQTLNFAGRKRRIIQEDRLCCQCGQTMGKSCKKDLCRQCEITQDRPNSRKVERPPIEIIQQQVRDFGYTATGRYYGVSDNAVRKWLKNTGM